MSVCYDEKIYGIKWSFIVDDQATYHHSTVFERSQNRPITENREMFEETRAKFSELTEQDKNTYRFFVYNRGSAASFTEDKPDTFFIWVPYSVDLLERFFLDGEQV